MLKDLNEAIKHCNEKAKECTECAKEHKQLETWLKELKTLKENVGVVAVYQGDTGCFDGYTKGHSYLVIDSKEDPERVIVITNDCGGSSTLLRSKFEFID